MAKEISCNIVKSISVLSQSSSGYSKQVNLVSWNGAEAKVDIRVWTANNERGLKGIALNNDEARKLYEALAQMYSEH